MRGIGRAMGAALVALLGLTLVGAGSASAGAPQGAMVGAVPGARTPHVLDNRVYDIEEVGDRIVVSGSFTKVRDSVANGGAEWAQPYVFAFDPVTGAIDRRFAPRVSAPVYTVLAGSDDSVYLAGSFYELNGKASRNLVNVSLDSGIGTGLRVPHFNGRINDLAMAGGRLVVAGTFTTVGGVPHGGLAALNSVSGALDEYVGLDVAGNASWPSSKGRAAVGVSKIDVSPAGNRLVAIGNFRTVDGLPREQAVTVLLQPERAVVDPNWRTQRYEPTCSTNTDTYVRDVEFSPDGSFFSIVTTGGTYSGTLCDTAARWDVATTGQNVQPRWAAFTGGDTLLSVAVTDVAVYVGGHQRWMNNPSGRDSAAPGAVPRPGLSALDPRTGVPLAWNPGRNPRGYGAEALLATESGLYVGMDTEYFGHYTYKRPRLGFFPLAEGARLPSEDVGRLPSQVHLAGRTSSTGGVNVNDVRTRFFDGTTASADTLRVTTGTDWSRARGAVLVGDRLFYGYPGTGGSYYLFRRTFDGTTFGPATQVDPYNDPYWSTKSAGSKNGVTSYYRGKVPSFYGAELSSVSAMAYRDGRLYYTRTGYKELFYRHFSVDSGVVSEQRFVASASGFDGVAGLIMSGSETYQAGANSGNLYRITFTASGRTGMTLVSGPTKDGRDWRTRAMFLGPRANQAPTATFTTACTGLNCTFDGRGSVDVDGRVVTYAWDFGDGTTGTGATASRNYASAGTRTVQLTVTDDRGATARTTRTVTVEAPPPPENEAPEPLISTTCAALSCSFDGTGSTDPDGTVRQWAWDFGDGTTGTGPTAEHTYAAAGDYTVTLTVTDDDGRSATATSTVPVSAPPPVGQGIGLRGSAGTGTTTVSQVSLTVPDSVRPGDALVLVLSTNSTATGTAPAGFTQSASLTAFGLNPTTQVFQRVAGSTDAGSELTVALSAGAKATLQLLAYSGTHASTPIASVTGAESPAGTAHTTPRSTAGAGHWVVSVWSDKQANARTWTAPAGTTERSHVGGVGNGDIATLVADSGGPVAAGPVGGLTATVPTASNRAATYTIVLAPAG